MGVDEEKEVRGAVAAVLIVFSANLTGLRRNWDAALADELDRRLVEAHDGSLGVRALVVEVEHVLHPHDELGVHRGIHHIFLGSAQFTDKQGQYLAFIHAYTKLNRGPPAEGDMQRFFEVTPPIVHRMVIELEQRGLIRRTPRVSRSIELLVAPSELPELD